MEILVVHMQCYAFYALVLCVDARPELSITLAALQQRISFALHYTCVQQTGCEYSSAQVSVDSINYLYI
jgi:hypothetical protein